MFAPTKTWRRWHRKINVTQRRYAIASAIAATGVPALVMARGHSIEQIPEVPLVVSDKVNTGDVFDENGRDSNDFIGGRFEEDQGSGHFSSSYSCLGGYSESLQVSAVARWSRKTAKPTPHSQEGTDHCVQ